MTHISCHSLGPEYFFFFFSLNFTSIHFRYLIPPFQANKTAIRARREKEKIYNCLPYKYTGLHQLPERLIGLKKC